MKFAEFVNHSIIRIKEKYYQKAIFGWKHNYEYEQTKKIPIIGSTILHKNT